MAANSIAKKRKWYIELCKGGCQLCGRKIPTLTNNGLEWSHIISKNDGGTDEQVNCLALCPTCSRAFDTVIKPALYNAFKKVSIKDMPDNWKNGEGRLGNGVQ